MEGCIPAQGLQHTQYVKQSLEEYLQWMSSVFN